MSETKFDPRRRLCPDGSCIGVVGADGRCGECGRAAGGAAEPAGEAAPGASDGWKQEMQEVEDAGSDAGEDAEQLQAAPADSSADGFDPKRRLCEDGSCVGLVGADGRCNVCGLQGT